ncbi:regulator of G-protein signaling [Acrasis kona]|uniref:Regulator of G-protein signaling n=1 Tax=Acrasis kona TaxID=1008807 RepID=A0AAW2Z4L0_9EUKA
MLGSLAGLNVAEHISKDLSPRNALSNVNKFGGVSLTTIDTSTQLRSPRRQSVIGAFVSPSNRNERSRSQKEKCIAGIRNTIIPQSDQIELLSEKSVQELLRNRRIRDNFRQYCELIHCSELLKFYEAVNFSYKTMCDSKMMLEEAKRIVSLHLTEGVPGEINTCEALKKGVLENIELMKVDIVLFDEILDEIESVNGVLVDAFDRYKEFISEQITSDVELNKH